MEGRGKTNTAETLLVTVILIIFSVAVFTLVAAGGETYKKIIDGKDSSNRARTALSYVSVKIRQNDTAGAVSVSEDAVEGTVALVIRHTGELAGMTTYIFYLDGILWESFIQDPQTPGRDSAMRICSVDSFRIASVNGGKMIYMESGYGRSGLAETLKIVVLLRSDMQVKEVDPE